MSTSIGDVRQYKGKLTWFKLILQGNLKRKSLQPCVSTELRHSHLGRTRSYLTEQFTKSQSVLFISWVMKTMILSEVLRCSAFILPSFHTHCSLSPSPYTSQTEGGGRGWRQSVLSFVPFHSIFSPHCPKMDPSQVRKTSFTAIHQGK